MFTYLITPKDQKKIQLFQYLLFSKHGRTLHCIEKELLIKQYTIRRYIKEISHDIAEVFKENTITIENYNNRLNIIAKREFSNDYLLTTLQSFYIQNGPLSKILSYLTSNSANSIIDLAHSLNYSESTIYKMTADLFEMLKLFDVELDLNSNKQTKFKGDEFGIRYFLFLIILNLYYADKEDILRNQIPFEFTDSNFTEKALNFEGSLSYSKIKRLTLMIAIASYRLVYTKTTLSLPESFFQDSKFFYNDSISFNLESFNIDKNILEKESHILSVLSHLFITDAYSFEQKKIIVNDYLSSNLEISTRVKKFLTEFQNQFKITYSEASYIENFYLILLYILRINYFKLKNDSFLMHPITEQHYKAPKDSPNYNEISKILIELSEKLPLDFTLNQKQKVKTSYFLYLFYEINKANDPIKIYISHIDVSISMLIKQSIKRLFTSDTIEICLEPDKADLLISNIYEGEGNKPIFVLDNIYNNKSWIQLFKTITNMSLLKHTKNL